MTILTRALLIAVLSTPLAASAQAPANPPRPGDTPKSTRTEAPSQEKLTQLDLEILAFHHDNNAREIDLGKHVSKHGASEAVKAYGAMLVKDHDKLDQDLVALARKTRQAIPPHKPTATAEKEAAATAKKRVAELKKLKGAGLDREYLRTMVDEHHLAVMKVDQQIAQAKHPELADLLRQAKPVLQRHHDRARELLQDQPQAMR